MLPSAILFIIICYECIYGDDDDYYFVSFIRYRKRTIKIDLEVGKMRFFYFHSVHTVTNSPNIYVKNEQSPTKLVFWLEKVSVQHSSI